MNVEANQMCPRCGDNLQKTTMFIVEGPCWKCEATMMIAINHRGNTIGPDEFTNDELEFAESKGVVIKLHDMIVKLPVKNI